MFDNLEIMRLASGLASHASSRQTTIAQNIANADTPGYRSRDISDFQAEYFSDGRDQMRATRAEHFHSDAKVTFDEFDAPGATKPNGNTVSLENEIVKATEVRHQHEMALAVYKSSLDLLRSSLGRR